MAKTETIRARVEPELKQKADEVLAELGVTATDAITRMYEEVVNTRALPFEDAEKISTKNQKDPHPRPREHTQASRSESEEDTVLGEQRHNDVPTEGHIASSSEGGAVSLKGLPSVAGIKPVTVFVVLGALAFTALLAVLLYLLTAERSHTHDEYAEHTHTHAEYAESTHAHDEYAEHTHTHAEYAESTHAHDEYAEHTHVMNSYGQQLLAGPSACFPNCPDPYGFSPQQQYPAPSAVPSPAQFWPSPQLSPQPNSSPGFYYCPDGEQNSLSAVPSCVYWGTNQNTPSQ